MSFNSEFEKLGNMFLAAIRHQAGVTSVTSDGEIIVLPQFNEDMSDIVNPLSIDYVTRAMTVVRASAPETVRQLEHHFRQLIAQAEAGLGIDDAAIQGYIESGSQALSTVFSGLTAMMSAKNTSTTNTNTTTTVSDVSSSTQSTSKSSSTNVTFVVGGLAILGILALAVFKR